MAAQAVLQNLRASISQAQAQMTHNTRTTLENETSSAPQPSQPSLELINTNSKIVLGPKDQLPAHLITLLEDWHKDHPEEPPCASHSKNPLGGQATQRYFSRDSIRLPPLQEISITKPVRYNVYYLPIRNGSETGVLIKFLGWGNKRHFMKKWAGGYKFVAEPVGVRLTAAPDSGPFPEFPKAYIWQSVATRKLPNEMKEETTDSITPSSIPSKRRREEDPEDSESGRSTVSSSGGDIPPQIIKRPSAQAENTAASQNSRTRRKTQPSLPRGFHALMADASGSELEDENEDADETDDQDKDKEQPQFSGLTNRGLPVISRSMSHAELARPSTAQKQPDKHRSSRKSLPNTLNAKASTSPLLARAPGTASDSGVDIPPSDSTSITPSSSRTIIKFKFLVPRTKMVRDLRVEDNDDNSEYLFDQAREFFRRYDRLVETPVLECVVEGEPECRCVYNAKELSYFIEELRERRGIMKVTVTQSS